MENNDASKYRITIQDKTFGVDEIGYVQKEGHKYLKKDDDRIIGIIPFVGEELATHYVKGISFKKFKIDNNLLRVTYRDHNGQNQKSVPFNYKMLTDSLRKSGYFDASDYNLWRYESFWMDFTVNARQQFHISDTSSSGLLRDGTPQQQYGTAFPIKPVIDREGFIITSFTPQLTKKIQKTRLELVETSDRIFEFEWLYKLKELINDSISLLDITLLQIYTKAQFDPLDSWNRFDPVILGEKHNRRLLEKIKWVKQISRVAPNIEGQFESIVNLKEIRNHLNHFDPPTFAITLEEAAELMNQVLDVAFALCKIRKAIGVELSADLINLVLQKRVSFVPEVDFLKRPPLNKLVSGYRTSLWPEASFIKQPNESFIKYQGRIFNFKDWITIDEYATVHNLGNVNIVSELISNGIIPLKYVYRFPELNNLCIINRSFEL